MQHIRRRSLPDSNLKDIRGRYLKIDDELAARLRTDVRRLLRFSDSIPDAHSPPSLIEAHLADNLPRRLFDLLVQDEEAAIIEVPGIGQALHDHLTKYYRFRKDALRVENDLQLKIGRMVSVEFP